MGVEGEIERLERQIEEQSEIMKAAQKIEDWDAALDANCEIYHLYRMLDKANREADEHDEEMKKRRDRYTNGTTD